MLEKSFLKNLNILYVEDEIVAAKKFSKILQSIFNTVYTASNGKEGLDFFTKENIDIIVSDINMPIMDGLTMSEEIRKIDKDIPIILITARTETDCLIKAIELNISSYILKPMLLDDFINKIDSVSQKLKTKLHKKLFEQYKEVVDQSSIVMKYDLNGKILYINDKYTHISGFTQNEVEDKIFNFNAHKDIPEKIFPEIWETIENKKIWKGKLKNTAKNSSIYITETTILPILDIKNNIKEYISVSNDITDQESLNDIFQNQIDNYKYNLLEKTQILNQYKKSLEQSTILIRLNKEFEIIYVNNKFLNIIKKSRNNLIKKNIFDILCCDNSDCFEIIDSLKDKKFTQKVLKIGIKNNTTKHLDISISPIFSNNELYEFLLIGTDISETIELYQEIEDTQKDVIFTLGSIGESRSKETGNHVKRVAEYSYLIAKKLGYDETKAKLIRTASPMHDIGKVAIPDKILLKQLKLTEQEYKIMQTHTTIGFSMLKNSNREILRPFNLEVQHQS